MNLSDSVYSDNYFFIVGISALLTPELIEENYYIVDVECSSLQRIAKYLIEERKVIAFISNDLDYYALRHWKNITFIDKRYSLKEILSCIFVNDSIKKYKVQYQLSSREKEVLKCLLKGMTTVEICSYLKVTVKTFYSHRRNLISKLRIGNRVSLYNNIARIIICNS
ncbi:TPA: helix-turn-helix transcriptional regulator [Enterobacter cloacae]|nr:helix-turn-helix transcriptional regulator [Enterobacter cloacae]